MKTSITENKYKLSDIVYLYYYITLECANGEFDFFVTENSEQSLEIDSPHEPEYRILVKIFKLYDPCENNYSENFNILINDLICSRDLSNQTMALAMLTSEIKTKI